jgi:hypothetical protein
MVFLILFQNQNNNLSYTFFIKHHHHYHRLPIMSKYVYLVYFLLNFNWHFHRRVKM